MDHREKNTATEPQMLLLLVWFPTSRPHLAQVLGEKPTRQVWHYDNDVHIRNCVWTTIS